jgi:hypothetical protein
MKLIIIAVALVMSSAAHAGMNCYMVCDQQGHCRQVCEPTPGCLGGICNLEKQK